ncbi:cupin domain-containing protein [Rhizobium azibense]|uniref:cupin domain-containing protein n=1 Tax=Rhizobium azibense TaxID=1136135 RepID=UPI00315D00B0
MSFYGTAASPPTGAFTRLRTADTHSSAPPRRNHCRTVNALASWVEEVLSVIAGETKMWIDVILTSGQSLIVPAHRKHGLRNVGSAILRIHASLASASSRQRLKAPLNLCGAGSHRQSSCCKRPSLADRVNT